MDENNIETPNQDQNINEPEPLQSPIGKDIKNIDLIIQKITNPNFKNKLLKLAAFLVILIFTVFIAAFAFRMIRTNNLESTSSPLPTASTQPEIKNPSPYYNDEEILEIEDRIQKIEKELDIVNFREETLRIPSLDWEINF